MTKKKAIILMIIITLAGSIVTFYGTNLLLSDVSNMFYMTVTKDVISSLPIFFISLDFVLAAIALIRLYRHPQFRKCGTLLYSGILFCFSAAGIVSTVLTGTVIYHSFTAPYPFKGATLLCLFIHTLLAVISVIQIKRAVKWENDSEKRKIKLHYIIYTAFLSTLVFYAFNRTGAFLMMASFVQLSTLNITVWFYLALLLPLLNLMHSLFYSFDVYSRYPKLSLIYAIAQTVLCIVLFLVTVLVCMKNTAFISAVSPAVAIERLITIPIDTYAHFGLVLLQDLYELYIVIRNIRKGRL